MSATSVPATPTDYYFNLIKPLSHHAKLELITRLSQSLQEELKPAETTPLSALFGAYKSEETAEDMIADLRAARSASRFTEPL